MSNLLFSVIIPVYNVERYLQQCIKSVLTQTCQDFEIILVDDGSTDGSGEMCDEFKNKNTSIIVIHKKNGGLSSARNAGILKSKGKYLLFLDSDDYWDDKYALEKVKKIAEQDQVEVIQYSAKLLVSDRRLIEDSFIYPVDFLTEKTLDELRFMIKNQMIVGSACTKAIQRSFLVDNSLFFKNGIKSEDIEWVLRLSACLPSYAFVHDKFYVYRKGRTGSITQTLDLQHLLQYLEIIADCFNNKEHYTEEICNVLKNYVAYQYVILLGYIGTYYDKEKKNELLELASKYKELMKYTLNPKVKKISWCYSLLGYNITVWLLGCYLRIK